MGYQYSKRFRLMGVGIMRELQVYYVILIYHMNPFDCRNPKNVRIRPYLYEVGDAWAVED